MSALLNARRRMLAKDGRPMTLGRPNPASGSPPANVTVQGFLFPYAPEKIAGALRQGDAQVQILDDEITAAAWPGPPTSGDWLVIDGLTWFVQGSGQIFDGAALIGYSLWVRGGEP